MTNSSKLHNTAFSISLLSSAKTHRTGKVVGVYVCVCVCVCARARARALICVVYV